MNILKGQSASKGFAFGKLTFYRHNETSPIERRPIVDAAAELEKFQNAVNKVSENLDDLFEKTCETMGDEAAMVFQVHQMIIEDPDFQEYVEKTIQEEKVCAEYAVKVSGDHFAQIFSSMEDNSYMQGRDADVLDVTGQLIREIMGETNSFSFQGDEPIILAAQDLLPSETAKIDTSKITAFVTAKGSLTSHSAIFARTMGIPAIVGTGNLPDSSLEGKQAALDGQAGTLYIDPDAETLARLKKDKKAYEEDLKEAETFRGKETLTADGKKMKLCANAGSLNDIHLALEDDAEGVGLLRSEFLYLACDHAPDEETLFTAYRDILSAMENKDVVIRTLDIGADKQVDYLNLSEEENPALGLRAVRLCLTKPDLFKTQLRALYRASVFGKLNIMVPMITGVEDVRKVKSLIQTVKDDLTRENIDFKDDVPLGIMIETPAAAVMSDELAKEVDFFSVGTNDLTQYTMALDRMNENLVPFEDPDQKAVLRLIELAAKNAHKEGIWIGICGEMGSNEKFLKEFVRMGIDELSMTPTAILSVRRKISKLSSHDS